MYKVLVRVGGRVYWYNGNFGNLTPKQKYATTHDHCTARNVQNNLQSSDCLAQLVLVK